MKLSRLLLAFITMLSFSLNAKDIKLTETSNQLSITSKSLSEFTFVNHLSEITALKINTDIGVFAKLVVGGYGENAKSGDAELPVLEELINVPVANTSNLIAGKMPGVMTRQNSGLPGGENTQIRIRGFSESPLVLVDGVQMDFSRVDQNDIASISVLKDASAAVYGARAGNGVILVTTKRGQEGAPKISFSSSYTSQSATAFIAHGLSQFELLDF